MRHQCDVACTQRSNGAEALVMILFWAIGMSSAVKKYVEVSSGDKILFAPALL